MWGKHMPQNNFIKQNFVLVLGLALPVLLMAGFLVATAIPNMLTPPPQYDAVFSSPNNSGTRQRAVSVDLKVNKDGVLMATYTPQEKDKNNNYTYSAWESLYLFDAKTQTVRPLDFPVPDDADSIKKKVTRPVAATKGMVLSSAATSPDGYTYSSGGYRGGGDFIGGLFWGGGHYREASLVKGNASTPIRMDAVPPYYSSISTTFIGWVTDKRE
jgi:hypothetical protein